MAHMEKYVRSQTGHLTEHFERKMDENGEYIKFDNENIDLTKTNLNYNLAPERNQTEFIRERCKELKCLKRNDVNVMCSWVVTAPKDLPEFRQEEFFKHTYDFLQNRYGSKNVVSSYVHMDEITPHMHFAFVPVVYDRKKGREKVSAKECINKHDLQTFHQDLSRHMERTFGYDIGVLNGATKDGNTSIEELKRKSATERLNEAKAQSGNIIENAKMQAGKIQKDIDALKEQKEALQSEISNYRGTIGTFQDIESMGKKSLLGKVTLTPDEADMLKTQAKAYFAEKDKRIQAENIARRLGNTHDSVMELTHEKISLVKEINTMKSIIKSSPELLSSFNQRVRELKQEQEQRRTQRTQRRTKPKARDYGMER